MFRKMKEKGFMSLLQTPSLPLYISQFLLCSKQRKPFHVAERGVCRDWTELRKCVKMDNKWGLNLSEEYGMMLLDVFAGTRNFGQQEVRAWKSNETSI